MKMRFCSYIIFLLSAVPMLATTKCQMLGENPCTNAPSNICHNSTLVKDCNYQSVCEKYFDQLNNITETYNRGNDRQDGTLGNELFLEEYGSPYPSIVALSDSFDKRKECLLYILEICGKYIDNKEDSYVYIKKCILNNIGNFADKKCQIKYA